jgi:hypothetical protein
MRFARITASYGNCISQARSHIFGSRPTLMPVEAGVPAGSIWMTGTEAGRRQGKAL